MKALTAVLLLVLGACRPTAAPAPTVREEAAVAAPRQVQSAAPTQDGIVCVRVTTAQYRRQLKAQGVDLRGMDIDHIVPHHLGGADHPDNYQVITAHLNRSLGDYWGPSKCEMVGRDRCAKAVAVSKKCGSFRE